MNNKIPRILQQFHLPRGTSFAIGDLQISGIGKYLFPKSPVRTAVRTKTNQTNNSIVWTRSFGGEVFLQSIYTHSKSKPISTDTLHDVETLQGCSFLLDWEEATKDNVVRPKHVSTSFLGVVPIPKLLLSLDLEMAMHSDGNGWDLTANVDVLNSLFRLIGYTGAMHFKPMDDHTSEKDTKDTKDTKDIQEMQDLKAVNLFDLAAKINTDIDLDNTDDNQNNTISSPKHYVPEFHDLVLFDGHCNMCNQSVNFLMSNDHQSRLMYCAQQTKQAQHILQQHFKKTQETMPSLVTGDNAATGDDSLLVLGSDGILREKSAAAFRVGAACGFPFVQLCFVGSFLPKIVVDTVYDWIGRNRYKWFGRKETCRLPTREEQEKFL